MFNLWVNVTKNTTVNKTAQTNMYIFKKQILLNIIECKTNIHNLVKHSVNAVYNNLIFSVVSINNIFFYKIYIEYINTTYKFQRILFNLPVKKIRTHGKSRQKKWIHSQSILYCIKTNTIFKNLKLPVFKLQTLLFCEFINTMWFFNWWDEWFSSHKTRIKSVKKNPYVKWNFDADGLRQGRVSHFLTKKKKAKHNRKKKSFLKNTYNVGFYYGFSIIYLKKILNKVNSKKKKLNVKSKAV